MSRRPYPNVIATCPIMAVHIQTQTRFYYRGTNTGVSASLLHTWCLQGGGEGGGSGRQRAGAAGAAILLDQCRRGPAILWLPCTKTAILHQWYENHRALNHPLTPAVPRRMHTGPVQTGLIGQKLPKFSWVAHRCRPCCRGHGCPSLVHDSTGLTRATHPSLSPTHVSSFSSSMFTQGLWRRG